MSTGLEVCRCQICADTDQTEKAAFPTRGGTARLETEPGKAVAVLDYIFNSGCANHREEWSRKMVDYLLVDVFISRLVYSLYNKI